MAELVYVDEQRGQRNQVLRSAVASKQFTSKQVEGVIPESSIDKTIELILSHKCKVLITDYRLSDHKPDVQFTGADLVREFQDRFDRFPCFITTSFAGEAVDEPIDTNMIFPKSDFLGINPVTEEGRVSELTFFVRVRKKIDEYDAFVSRAMEEWRGLLTKKDGKKELNAQESQRLLELDNMLEAIHGKHVAVEGHLKCDDTLQSFEKLIEKTQVLIDRIENEIEQ